MKKSIGRLLPVLCLILLLARPALAFTGARDGLVLWATVVLPTRLPFMICSGVIVALDGVAIVVNPENTVEDLTVDQIAQIFKGEITNWKDLGGADEEIAVYGREAGSGTRGAFEELVGVEDACKYLNEYSSTGDVIGNVASNPSAIGYASLSAVGDNVKAVKVNGVECSEATVQDGTYEIQRPFVMITKDGTQLSDAAQAFLDFAMSADAASLIAQAGAVPPAAK